MSILRVGLVTLALVVLGVGAIAVGVAVDSGTKAKSPRSVTSSPAAPRAKALTPAQQKQADTATKRLLAARAEYAKLRRSGAPEVKLAAPRAKMVKAQRELRALGVTTGPRRLADGSGCSTGGGCGGRDESKGGCSMTGGGGCSMGATEKSPNQSAAAKPQKEAHAGQAGKSASRATGQAGHAGHATGHGGAAVGRGGDAAGHDGGHSAHGGAAKAQGIRLASTGRLGIGAATADRDCCGANCQGCCDRCDCCEVGYGDQASQRS